MQGEKPTVLDLEDDVVLISDSTEQLQILTNAVVQWARVIGLTFQCGKNSVQVDQATDTWELKNDGLSAKRVDDCAT